MTSSVRKRAVRDLILSVGENPDRSGLKETPDRVDKAWDELFTGYKQDPAKIFKTFEEDEISTNQLILLKNIEFTSICEHHLLPFYGIAHIAYVSKDRVLGASKLARLLDVYAKRLQMQERIGDQVTKALMRHLQPEGAACIIRAKHLCISSRGVTKQKSEFVTASLTGSFLEEDSIKAELYNMINI